MSLFQEVKTTSEIYRQIYLTLVQRNCNFLKKSGNFDFNWAKMRGILQVTVYCTVQQNKNKNLTQLYRLRYGPRKVNNCYL
jgi:hypothetical protein